MKQKIGILILLIGVLLITALSQHPLFEYQESPLLPAASTRTTFASEQRIYTFIDENNRTYLSMPLSENILIDDFLHRFLDERHKLYKYITEQSKISTPNMLDLSSEYGYIEITYDTTLDTDKFYSVLFTEQIKYPHENNPRHNIFAFTFSRDTGTPIDLLHFFKKDIRDIILNQLSIQGIRNHTSIYKSFAISDSHLYLVDKNPRNANLIPIRLESIMNIEEILTLKASPQYEYKQLDLPITSNNSEEKRGILTTQPEQNGIVALCFENGPHPLYSVQILQTLDDFDAHGNFFVLGKRAGYFPELTKYIQNNHTLGVHGYDHTINYEIKKALDTIQNTTGKYPRFRIAPYDSSYFSLNPTRYSENLKYLLDHIAKNLQDGDIIRLPENEFIASNLSQIIETIYVLGYDIVSYEEILKHRNLQ